MVWAGKALVFIGTIHVAYGFFHFWDELWGFVENGLWNSTIAEVDGPLAFWFVAIGFLAMLLGGLMDWAESTVGRLPASLPWILLAYSIIGVVLLPVSGLWLILGVSVALCVKGWRRPARLHAG